MNEREVLQTEMGDVYVEDGIIVTIMKHPNITLEVAKKHQEQMMARFADLFPAPMLADTTHLRHVSKEARDYWAKPENSGHVRCTALLIQSTFARIAGNLFLQFNKPKFPTKLFTDKAKAVEWLREMTR